jgi:hypothetical protein
LRALFLWWGEAPERDQPPAMICYAGLYRLMVEAAWPSRALGAVSLLSAFVFSVAAGINATLEEKTSPVCLLHPTPGSALLLQLLGGPTVEGRLCQQLVADWSLAQSTIGSQKPNPSKRIHVNKQKQTNSL